MDFDLIYWKEDTQFMKASDLDSILNFFRFVLIVVSNWPINEGDLSTWGKERPGK